MQTLIVVFASALLGASVLGGCGRIGYDALKGEQDDDPERPSADAGPVPGMDGGGSGSGPDRMDASMEAGPGAGGEGGMLPADAGQDATISEDAGDDDDAGSDPPSCPISPITDYCAELPRLSGMPLIDGELECGLMPQPITPVNWTAVPPLPAGHGARLAAAWLPAGLYVYVDVDDSSRLPAVNGMASWCGDGVEVYADADGTFSAPPAYDDPGTAQLIARAPEGETQSVTTDGERYRSAALLGAWTSTRYGTFPRPGGYVFEVFIAQEDLDLGSWTLQGGGSVGLNVSLNLSPSAWPAPMGETTDCGRRMGQYFLRVAEMPCAGTCFPFSDVTAFCTPVLRE